MSENEQDVSLAAAITELQKTNANTTMLHECVSKVIEGQAAAAEHVQALHVGLVDLRKLSAKLGQRQGDVEARMDEAVAKLQNSAAATSAPPSPTPQAASSANPEQASKKTRLDEHGHSWDASPAASAAHTPLAQAPQGSKMQPNVSLAPADRQPRSLARRSSPALAPASSSGRQLDEVVLLRVKPSHAANFAHTWLLDLLKSLPKARPPHEERILNFHGYVTLVFDDRDSADDAGKLLRQGARSRASKAKRTPRRSRSFTTARPRSASATLGRTTSGRPSMARNTLAKWFE